MTPVSASPSGATVTRLTEGLPVFYLDCPGRPEDLIALAYLASSSKTHLAGIGIGAGKAGSDSKRVREAAEELIGSVGRGDTLIAAGDGSTGRAPVLVRHLRDVSGAAHSAAAAAGSASPSSASPSSASPSSASTGPASASLSSGIAEESAPELIVRLARQYRGRLRIVALGPLTNIAAALELEPGLPGLVKEITVTGGAIFVDGETEGSAEGSAERDFAVDAAAAAVVLGAEWPLTLIPLDVTTDHLVGDARGRALAEADGPLTHAIEGLVESAATARTSASTPTRAMRVPLAVAVATGDLVPHSAPTMQLSVDCGPGPHQGRTRYRILDMGVLTLGFPYRNRTSQQCRVVLSVHRAADGLIVDRALAARADGPRLVRASRSA